MLTAVHWSFAAQEDESVQRLPNNLEVIQRLSLQIGDSLAGLVEKGDSVRVLVRPAESSWFVEEPVLRAFSRQGRFPTQSLSAASEVDVGVLSAKVQYSSIRRRGFFEEKVLDRTVSIEVSGKVVDARSGAILLHRNFFRSASDTVALSEVEALENAGIPATHGVVPHEDFFSSLLEPLVMIGAVAVAVFLLFRVRS